MEGAAVGSIGLTLTLVSAAAWSLLDAVRKGLATRVSPVALGVWLPLSQVPLLMLWAVSRDPFSLPLPSLGPMAASVVLSLLGVLWFMQALRSSPMSITVPLLSFTPVLATMFAWIFRNQVPTLAQGVGMGLVVLGAMVLGMKSSHWPGLRAFLKETGVRYMTGASLAWSLTAIFNQAALQAGANAWYAPNLSLGVGLLMALVMLAMGHRSLLQQAFWTLCRLPLLSLGAMLVGGAALTVELEALRHAPIGLIELVKRGVGMSGAVLLGWFFFREPIVLPKVLAVVIMTAGVALVVLRG